MRASLLRIYLVQIDRMLSAVQKAAGVEPQMQPAALEIAISRAHLQQALVDLPEKSSIPAPVRPAQQPITPKRIR